MNQLIIIMQVGYEYLINLVQFNSDITKSNVIIKGRTIDCKAFSSYGDIICIYVGYDGCNLNVYKKDITSSYSETLIQKMNLVELGFDCNSKSQGQKIYNINGNKFLICYSKYEDNSFYCITGEHNSINSIKIKSKTSTKIISECSIGYHYFDIGKINSNYILICTKNIGYKYIVFSEDLNIIGSEQINSFNDCTDCTDFTILPSILYLSSEKTFLTINYYDSTNDITKYFELESPKCKTPTTPNIASINTDINVDITSGIESYKTEEGDKTKIKIFIPLTAISNIQKFN